MGNRITIRPAVPEDADVIIGFNQSMAMETEERTLPDEVISSGVRNVFTHPEYGFYLVAEKDGVIAGSLMVTYEWSDWRNGLFWWVQSVYVPTEFRRQGIYAKLYEYVTSHAAERKDVCGVRLYVEKENETAQKTYEALGMTQCYYHMYEEMM